MSNYNKLAALSILSLLIVGPTLTSALAVETINLPITNSKDIIHQLFNVEITAIDSSTGKPAKKAWAYSIESTYRPSLGCSHLFETNLFSIPGNILPLYPCNTNPNTSNATNLKTTQEMLNEKDSLLSLNQLKLNPKTNLYSKTLTISSTTIAIALCNEQGICKFYDRPAALEMTNSKKPLQLTLKLPKLVDLSDSTLIFSKFSDGKNPLPNFISEIETIKFISAYNTVLYEVKPQLAIISLTNFYSTKVPFKTNKIEICTTYNYCFTTKLEETMATYLEDKKPARLFELNITNNTLADYKSVTLKAENANFTTTNSNKRLTLKYVQLDGGPTTLRVMTDWKAPVTTIKIHKNYRSYKGLELCDDTTCLPVTTLEPTACPILTEICLSAPFKTVKKSNLIYGYLLQNPNGSPAPYASILLPPTSQSYIYDPYLAEYDLIMKQVWYADSTKKGKALAYIQGSMYQSWPEYTKNHTYYADENGVITLSMDLDHYYSQARSCNLNSCYPPSYRITNKINYLFDQSNYGFPNQGKSLIFYGPSNQYDWLGKNDPTPISLKPGLRLTGTLLAKQTSIDNASGDFKLGALYFSPGAYLVTYDSDGKIITKTLTDSNGNYTLTLPSNFYKMDICDSRGKCEAVTTYDKYYYLTLDPKTIYTMTPYNFPAPIDRLGILKGILYDAKKKKIISNSKVYLFNDKQKLISTLTTNTKGEFSTPLTSIQSNQITRIQGCAKVGDCSYNHIRADEVNDFITEGLNFPFQVVKINN